MKATHRTLLLFILLLLTLTVVAVGPAHAGFYRWIDPDGGDWCSAENWDAPGYPSLFFDFALFDLDVAYAVAAPDPAGVERVGGVIVERGSVTLHTHDAFEAVLSVGPGAEPASLTLIGAIGSPAPMLVGGHGVLTLAGARLHSRATDSFGFSIETGGVLRGDGILDGNLLRNLGTVSPGAESGPAGALVIGDTAPGGYDQRDSGRLVIRVGGPEAGVDYGQLSVVDGSRGVLLDGTLEIIPAHDYLPAPGDRYEVLVAPAYQGEFHTVVFPDIPDRDFELVYEPSAVVVTVSGPSEILLTLDIQPGSCPNPLSTAKRGVITAAVLGTDGFEVRDIDLSSLLLEQVAPLRHGFRDAGSPTAEPCVCLPLVKDGREDLLLKFPADAVIAALGPVVDHEERRLTLTGSFLDGTAFRAEDCVLILAGGGRGQGRTREAPGAVIVAGEPEVRAASAPADGVQTIAYRLPETTTVRLTVFDVAGRRVTTLVNGTQPAGSHRVQWDAAGQPRGVYFYRLSTSDQVVTARAVLIR